MKLFRGAKPLTELNAGCVATIGNFDGVHRGHQALLATLRKTASNMNLPLVVLLFEPQPGEYFNQQKAPARLYRLREKLQALKHCGIDYVYCLKFDKQLANMLPTEFAEQIIFSRLNAKYLLLGDDFRFGRDRQGDLLLLKEIGLKKGAIIETYPDFCIESTRVSSTQIRHALYLGDLNCAKALLGREYSLCGRVMHGNGVGRRWGIPTANLNVIQSTLPLSGVFCVRVMRQGKPLLTGVANLGNRPTIDGSKNVLEVHLFDFDESLYGEMLQVFFLHKLRDEIKFSSVDALIAQIHSDVLAARNIYDLIE